MSVELRAIEDELRGYPGNLADEFSRSAESLASALSSEELTAWANEALLLAKHSLRSWEAATEYLRASPQTAPGRSFASFLAWAAHGRELATYSSIIARAYFNAGPATLSHLEEGQVDEWAALGASLYKGTWKSISLAARFFELGPPLLAHVPVADMPLLAKFTNELADRSYDLALACLDMAPQALAATQRADRVAFLEFAIALVEHSWADARVYFERGPGLVNEIEASVRARYLRLLVGIAPSMARQSYAAFAEGSNALARLDPSLHADIVRHAEALAPRSGPAAIAFVKSAPEVLSRVRAEALPDWYARGRQILESTVEGGEAFFRLESSTGENVLDGLSSRVELGRVSEVLRLYCKALTGTNVAIAPAAGLAERHIGWMSMDMPSTEGSSIYLPEAIEAFPEKERNFSVYKVYATHQAGHLEFGSFWFTFDRPGPILGDGGRRRLTARVTRNRPPITDMERFFDLFPDRQLASDLFAIVEDARVDARIAGEYSGIRRAYHEVQQAEVARRQPPETMPLRRAFVELLVRLSLDENAELYWPQSLEGVLRSGGAQVNAMRRDEATVEDAAEATVALYDLVVSIPNVTGDDLGLEPDDWETLTQPGDLEGVQPDDASSGADGDMAQLANNVEPGSEQPYESPEKVGFRGDFKPELVQLLMRLRQGEGADDSGGAQAPLTAEQLKELIEKSVEINLTDVAEGDLASSSGMFVENLMKEAEAQVKEKKKGGAEGEPGDSTGEGEGQGELPPEPKFFLYDEWDFRAGDYKPRWCRLMEQVLAEGETGFFERTTREKATLIAQTRKQFELLRPEMFRKIKGLVDGEEYDLDAVIEYVAERRSGITPNDKVYWRRNKVERDVSVAFLLDMSASTDEEIEKRKPDYATDDFDDDPRRYLSWWASRRAQEIMTPPKRIIDVEKESIVLLISALETIGDAYGIYGFSGYGRDNVEYYVIKDLAESFSERIKKRVDKITPIRSTRMGPAIRHTTRKLLEHDAKVKILFLVSDGRPQDHGYGRDRTEKEYAIHDTKMALTEAKRKGVTPFALTVDRSGHDYLKQMCDDMGYEVLFDVEALPGRLPTLYRKLTE